MPPESRERVRSSTTGRPVRAGGPGLSKSRFTTGLQCHRLLWWTVNEPDAPELVPPPEQQAIFDQGTRVGEVARSYIPGGQLIDLPYWEKAKRVEATREAIEAGKHVIYETSCLAAGGPTSANILHRAPRAKGWTVSEVKSPTKVKPQHIPDAGVQPHVLRRVGLPVARTEVMHLNTNFRHRPWPSPPNRDAIPCREHPWSKFLHRMLLP